MPYAPYAVPRRPRFDFNNGTYSDGETAPRFNGPSAPQVRSSSPSMSPDFPSPSYLDQINRVSEASDYRRSRQVNFDNSVRANNNKPLLPDGSGPQTYLITDGGRGGVTALPPGANVVGPQAQAPRAGAGPRFQTLPPPFNRAKAVNEYLRTGQYTPQEAEKGAAEDEAKYNADVERINSRNLGGTMVGAPGTSYAPQTITASGSASATAGYNSYGAPGVANGYDDSSDRYAAPQVTSTPATHPAAPSISSGDGSPGNHIQVTDQQAREMWRNTRSQYPSDAAAVGAFHDEMSHYGIDGYALARTWADGGTLNQQHYTITPGIHIPVSMLGPDNGMDAGQNGRLPQRGDVPRLGNIARQSTPGAYITAPSTSTPSAAPGYSPLPHEAPPPVQTTLAPANPRPYPQKEFQPTMTDEAVGSYRRIAQAATQPTSRPTTRASAKPASRPTTQAAQRPTRAMAEQMVAKYGGDHRKAMAAMQSQGYDVTGYAD